MKFELVALIFAVICIFGIILWLVIRRKNYQQSLFGREGIDVLPKSSSIKERAAFMDDIDVIIENSKKLGEVLVSSGTNGSLYEKIMLDKELTEKIKTAKSKKEIEEILLEWAKKYYPGIGNAKENEEIKNKENKFKRQKISPKPRKLKEEKTKKGSPKPEEKKEEGSGNDSGGGAFKEEKERIKKLDEETKQLYNEIKSLLESKNYDKLVEIIKNLKSERIESLIGYYRRNFGSDKFGKVLKNSSNPQDVLILLKMETIDGLNSELERIKDLAGYARRKGKDVQHQTLALLGIPQKVKMFAATFDKKDFYKVRSALLKIESEIDEILAEKKSEKKEDKPEKVEEKSN